MRIKKLPNAKNFPKFQRRQDKLEKREKIVILGVGNSEKNSKVVRKKKKPIGERKKDEQREYYNNFIEQHPIENPRRNCKKNCKSSPKSGYRGSRKLPR